MTKYLDQNGLAYFWTKIKAWLSSHAPVKYFGQNWIEDSNNDYALIVGNGANSLNPSNSFTIDNSGNVSSSGVFNLTNTTDASGSADNGPALIVGSRAGVHIEVDANEIQAKASGSTTSSLDLNADGGTVNINGVNARSASLINSGAFGTDRIPSLDASKIGSGTFADARIPNLNTSKLTAGILAIARGGTGCSNFLTTKSTGGSWIYKSIAANAKVALTSLSLEAGTWIILGSFYIPGGGSGYWAEAMLKNTPNAGSVNWGTFDGAAVNLNGGTSINVVWVAKFTGTQTWYLWGTHNASTRNCAGAMYAVKIG